MTWTSLWWQILLFVVLSYCFGNLNFAILISKFKKRDVRNMGSGNPGTMNMLRNFGVKIGAITLIFDALKGFFPALIGYLVYRTTYIEGFCVGDLMGYIAGLSAILGHIYPAFLKFKGGKGVATTIGVFLAVSPIWAIAMFAVLFLYILIFEYGSMGSFLFITGMCIEEGISLYLKYVPGGNASVPLAPLLILNIMIFLITVFTWWAHRQNIHRLCAGTEHRTSLMKLFKKKKEKSGVK